MDQEQPGPDAVVLDDEEMKSKEAEERRLRRLRRLFPFLMVILFLVYAFTTNLIPSSSMEPALKPGDQVLTMRAWLAYLGGRTPRRGDIVIFNLPPDQRALLPEDGGDPPPEGRRPIGVFREPPGEILIKRVVGLPGETIAVKNGQVLANGKAIPETYEKVPADGYNDEDFEFGGRIPVKLGPDEVFVMGDNRQVSEDSRFFGPIKVKNIRGRFVARLFHRDVKDPVSEKLKEAEENMKAMRLRHGMHRDIGR